MSSEISLQELFSRALKAASRAYNLPTIEDETQEYVQSALADLRLLASRISSLHLFSSNESLEDVSTRDLVYMSIPFFIAEVELNARTTSRDERQTRLGQARAHLLSFHKLLDAYEAVPSVEKKLYERKSSSVTDPAKRRELKIAQFKKEREIKGSIETLRRKRKFTEIESSNSFDLMESLLVPAPTTDAEDEEDEDVIREVSRTLLRLQCVQAYAHLESIDQELELLRNAPSVESESVPTLPNSDDEAWRLDLPSQRSGVNQQGSLLDPSGRPLRPFTILPSTASSERSRFQAEVFRPDHRLPTMSIDQYLEEEQRRGNIISGGGPQSATAPTKTEQLALDSELEGTLQSEEKAEEKRLGDEQWARFTDDNPKGAGNTMNRG